MKGDDKTSQPQRKLTKAEFVKVLTDRVEKWIADGVPPDEAVGRLTDKQYDFLIDQNVDLDRYLMTPQQIANSLEIKRAPRSRSPNGYNKIYPQDKQNLYNGIVNYIQSQGATVQPREKQNYRDLDFTIDGKHYRIVLSNPRS